MNSWAVSACYPQSTFYPLSDGPSIQNHRITMTCFRTCSTRRSRSQAPLCHCTRRLVSNQAEGTLARLRYLLGGDRPSQTTHQPPSPKPPGEDGPLRRVVFHRCLPDPRKGRFFGSHLSYASQRSIRWQVVVKLHGVFLSRSELAASSRPLQFHRAPG